MKFMKIFLGLVLVLAVGLVLVGPVGPLPGMFIGGNPTPVPEQWEDTSELHEIKLKVPSGLLRVATLWVVDYGGDLHVVSGHEGGWSTAIGQGGPVEMRMGDKTYSLTATRLSEGVEPIAAAYVAKYATDYPDLVSRLPSLEDNADGFTVFRLAGR